MIFGLFVCGHNCIGMGNYLLKHFLSEKEPKEFKLTVHGNSNALPRIWRPKLAEHFPSTRIAIIGIDYFAISRDCSEL